jgi:hypothetical protein
MSVVWSGAWVTLNAMAALFALLAVAVLIVARQRLIRAPRPVAVGATPSSPVVPLPERFRTLAPSADLIDAVAVTRRSLLASPPGTHPPLPAALSRPAFGTLPGNDAPDPRMQCLTTATMTPASNARLR